MTELNHLKRARPEIERLRLTLNYDGFGAALKKLDRLAGQMEANGSPEAQALVARLEAFAEAPDIEDAIERHEGGLFIGVPQVLADIIADMERLVAA